MGYLVWTLPFVLAGASCVELGAWQLGFNIDSQTIGNAEYEDQRGQGSCPWESPPSNGYNFRPCSEGLCRDSAGLHKRNGTLRFTRCDRHYVLVAGADNDVCVNGQWSTDGHRCIPCGKSQHTFNPYDDLTLIHYGYNSSRGDFPWMAALYTPLDAGKWEQICGGTLISPGLVLSAAHCFYISGQKLGADQVIVGLGKLFSSLNQREDSAVISYVKEVILPERYLGVDHLFDLDIALLVLKQNVVTSPYIMPACIDWAATMLPKHNEIGYLAGWGITEVGSPSAVLKWASQKYVQYEQCQKLMAPRDKKLVTQDKFCVAEVKGGKADKGDSGGGLTLLRDGTHYIYGVVSTKLTADDKHVRLFTNVLNDGHLAWLWRHWRRLLPKPSTPKPTRAPAVPPTEKVEKTFTLFIDNPMNWFAALEDCRRRGMRLATVESEDEQQQLVNLVKSKFPYRDYTYFWLAASDLGQTGDYVWITTGQPLRYNAWYTIDWVEPNRRLINGEREQCSAMRNNYGFKWFDQVCSQRFNYVCDNSARLSYLFSSSPV